MMKTIKINNNEDSVFIKLLKAHTNIDEDFVCCQDGTS